VADAFDAITSDRPYRSARPVSYAVEEIQKCSGTQFDPDIVVAFLKFVETFFPGVEYLRPVVERVFPDLQAATPNMDDILQKQP
jgi:HD-GYP domain-containing protein (c-di-GMP phosphodiesterase class II)